MTQVAIRENLLTSEEVITNNVVASPDNFWTLEKVEAQENRENLIAKPVIIYTFEEDKSFTREKQIVEELNEVREEVKETCEIDSDVSPVPEQAYEEALNLLKRMHSDVPVPDIMWLERGGIGLQWNPENSIVTMSLYGDNHVNFVAILGKQHEIAVTCPLSDQLLLPSFLETLPILFQKRT